MLKRTTAAGAVMTAGRRNAVGTFFDQFNKRSALAAKFDIRKIAGRRQRDENTGAIDKGDAVAARADLINARASAPRRRFRLSPRMT